MKRHEMESIVKMICSDLGLSGQPNEKRARINYLTDVAMRMINLSKTEVLDTSKEVTPFTTEIAYGKNTSEDLA